MGRRANRTSVATSNDVDDGVAGHISDHPASCRAAKLQHSSTLSGRHENSLAPVGTREPLGWPAPLFIAQQRAVCGE